jgi:hypothetical protein
MPALLGQTQVIDVPRRVAGMAGDGIGVFALAAILLGPMPFTLCETRPRLWQAAAEHEFSTVAGSMLLAAWIERIAARLFFARLRRAAMSLGIRSITSIAAAVATVALALIALPALIVVLEVSWWQAGGDLPAHDAAASGMVETACILLFSAGVVLSLSPLGFLHPAMRPRLAPSSWRELAWWMLAVETWAACWPGAITAFVLVRAGTLGVAGLEAWWLVAGLALTFITTTAGIALFVWLLRRARHESA